MQQVGHALTLSVKIVEEVSYKRSISLYLMEILQNIILRELKHN